MNADPVGDFILERLTAHIGYLRKILKRDYELLFSQLLLQAARDWFVYRYTLLLPGFGHRKEKALARTSYSWFTEDDDYFGLVVRKGKVCGHIPCVVVCATLNLDLFIVRKLIAAKTFEDLRKIKHGYLNSNDIDRDTKTITSRYLY